MSDSALPPRIPLFPLPLVLFPGQLKALRIFEPRYRIMLQDCLESGHPFGILLVRNGDETPAALPRIGTTAHIVQVVRQEDDTFAIQIYGGERFRVEGFLHDRPYLRADVTPFPLREAESPVAYDLARHVERLLPQYLDALTEASGFRFNIQTIPGEPEQLAYLAAIALQANNDTKQGLLASPSCPRLLASEIHLLAREMDLMAWITATLEHTNARAFGTANDLSLN
ncbi:MAG: peptidase S16 [Caldilineae bacterium]|nr:MAG: peptidase S16 [Caldilineae bacterium]